MMARIVRFAIFVNIILVVQRHSLCSSLVINPTNYGGTLRGDPAPGRSPGPPDESNVDRRKCSDQLDGEVKVPTEDFLLNFTVTHELFKTDVIVPGIVYKVSLRNVRPDSILDFTITSEVDDVASGKFISIDEESLCEDNVFKSRLRFEESTEIDWSIEQLNKGTNLTLRVEYQFEDDPSVYRIIHIVPISQDCQLFLKKDWGTISSAAFPRTTSECQVSFPRHNTDHGIVIEVSRLSVPCFRGYIHFYELNATEEHTNQDVRSPGKRLCGKLEELSESDRRVYFPSLHTPPVMYMKGNPKFTLTYHLVDYCYNTTLVARNGSFELNPTGDLECTFKIYLPYGHRIALNLQIGESSSKGTPAAESLLDLEKPYSEKCDGLLIDLLEGVDSWSHCSRPGDVDRNFDFVSEGNKIVLKVHVHNSEYGALSLRMAYKAAPVEEIVGSCGFGWVSLKHFCISAMEDSKLTWDQSEHECARQGGHLASIRSEHAQNVINNLVMNSPGYHDYNAYWIGATDILHEGDFRWSDGLPFSYTNWFPGWPQHGHYNKQPNDDGLSKQDCIEMRRIYQLPSSAVSLVPSFMWNDRDCSTQNYYLCERLQSDEPLEDNWPSDCNRTVELSRQQPRTIVSSPGFPRSYPDNAYCVTKVIAPTGYRLVLDFEELVLENEQSCSYDYLEISEDAANISSSSSMNSSSSARRLCGDWSSKLKLIRYVSKGSRLILRFSSDFSHHFGGYRARISMENALQCSDDRLLMFGNSCYLIVSYPEVTWATAKQICRGMKGQLASVLSQAEERFIKTSIRKSPEYRTSALYWLGAQSEPDSDIFKWTDGNPMDYLGWLPGDRFDENNIIDIKEKRCLGIQWTASPTPMLPSGLYWKSHKCDNIGGYVCKRPHQLTGQGIDFNKTIIESRGNLTTPHYPDNYYNQLDFSVKIIGPDKTRLVMKFHKIDIETQLECLYDYVELRSAHGQRSRNVRFCGKHDTDMSRFNFVSEDNQAEVHFHSDYSISGSGFFLTWEAVDVSACPLKTYTAKEDTITSPNFPNFILDHLDCSYIIQAPSGKRVWLEFETYDLVGTELMINSEGNDVTLELGLSRSSVPVKPFRVADVLTDGSFLSHDEILNIKLHSGHKPRGTGFKALYKMVGDIYEEKTITLQTNSSGVLLHLNYPNDPPPNVSFVQHFTAPLGYIISLQLFNLKVSNAECSENRGHIEVFDSYNGRNGTTWKLCYDEKVDHSVVPIVPVSITSFLNTIHLRQRSETEGVFLNGTLRVRQDPDFRLKLLTHRENRVESCAPNPCQNEGVCTSKGAARFCECSGHFTGLFCALTFCELKPCIFGTCELTATSYKCHCKKGYIGPTCEKKRRPCEGNPCESRGVCLEKGDDFHCQCHAWWEGPRCERRMLHIPYKPLSERMFHEPFWLGLMTVFIVMAVIGLVWCAKRHFPEKIEKLLAEESSRHNRSAISSLRSSSVREQLAIAAGGGSGGGLGASVTIAPSPGAGSGPAPRSFFGRLGIRKPSILSLTSPHAPCYVSTTARTFSLDDLFKSSAPRRTPSPKKKRNNSTPSKKNAVEKKQILQQLISPAPGAKHLSRKVSLCELMQLSKLSLEDDGNQQPKSSSCGMKETKFFDNDLIQPALSDPKLEKKVTFARLLNKVSAEMNSSSDVELNLMHSARLGCALMRPSSTPPSPNLEAARSPNSICSSNPGSGSFTSSDLAIPSALSSSISDFLYNARRSQNASKLHPHGRPKPSSADSIVAMFRNHSSSSSGLIHNLSPPLKLSPCTTPTVSSPQEDFFCGDDESSTSSVYTPVSLSSSGPPESPVLQHRLSQNTIEVPVLDPLSVHKSQNVAGGTSSGNFLYPPTITLELPSTINKCLSPIREMPTPLPSPMPSPALTPMMRRKRMCKNNAGANADCVNLDRISVDVPNSVSRDEDNDELFFSTDINVDPQAEDGLILEEAVVLQKNSKAKIRPLPVACQPQIPIITTTLATPQPLVIPTLTVQTPSPTYTNTPPIVLPGSPPPYRSGATAPQDMFFQFPSPKPVRKLYKDLDKPASLDLPCAPPMITITCNMSEADSDAESISPAVTKTPRHSSVNPSNMTYLSPFSMSARGEHMASESNLSSSGYSSMASPGPSRCGSSNPLCPSEMDDQPGGAHHRRSSLVIKSNFNSPEFRKLEPSKEQHRVRSDSETLSDDLLHESNDEGISTDHVEEKGEDAGKIKELNDVFVVDDKDTTLKATLDSSLVPIVPCVTLEFEDNFKATSKTQLQLPSIVVHCNPAASGSEKHLSPISSRSDSPLSDRTSGLGRFSPQFYGRNKDFLPFTDSDGLYDFPSSDRVNVSEKMPYKKTNRRRDKKVSRSCKTPSPTKSINLPVDHNHLDIPNKEYFGKMPPPRKLSPKRKIVRSHVVSSSSSSDSITSQDVRLSPSNACAEAVRWPSPVEWLEDEKCLEKSHEASGEETCDDANMAMLPKPKSVSKNQKISRLRTISHQIRFLRRLELRLKKKDRAMISRSESFESDDDDDEGSPRATSPLLQESKIPKIEIRAINSSAEIPLESQTNKITPGNFKQVELQATQDGGKPRRKTVLAGYGHSD